MWVTLCDVPMMLSSIFILSMYYVLLHAIQTCLSYFDVYVAVILGVINTWVETYFTNCDKEFIFWFWSENLYSLVIFLYLVVDNSQIEFSFRYFSCIIFMPSLYFFVLIFLRNIFLRLWIKSELLAYLDILLSKYCLLQGGVILRSYASW